jgi:RimJ/RimL family protein N-acetyltransferase
MPIDRWIKGDRPLPKLGFQPEGCKHRGRKVDGQYQDIMLMALMLENLPLQTDASA